MAGKRDGAAAPRLGVLLPASRLGLFRAGDHRELARVEIERPPAQCRYLPARIPQRTPSTMVEVKDLQSGDVTAVAARPG